MQKRKVNWIDVPFVALEVVASLKELGHGPVFAGHGEKFIIRQQWWIARPHVSENHSAGFLARMRAMADLIFVRAAARFAGLIEHPPTNIVKPAVIEAAQPAVFDASVTQVRAPMRTV